MDELSEKTNDRLTCAQGSRFLSQPFTSLRCSPTPKIRRPERHDIWFQGLLGGQYDDLPEMAFYGRDIDEVIAADDLAKQVA